MKRNRLRHRDYPRRQALAATGAALVGALSGCVTVPGGGSSGEPADTDEYERLQRTAVYVEDGVDLSIPDDVPTVNATNNAGLIVLPGDTTVDAERAVDWLADERVLALFGDDAENTWLTWARSDVYSDAFRGQGVADGDPDPDLLVAAAIDVTVTTHRYTWGQGPDDRDVLQGLDEALAEIQARTPH